MNPNYVPWMSLLGIIGLGIGWLVGGGGTSPQQMVPALYGLLIGSVTGVLVRMELRRRAARTVGKRRTGDDRE